VGEQAWAVIAAAREDGPFGSLADFCRRTRLAQEIVRNLIRAGACDSFGGRRELLWQLGDLDLRPGGLELQQEAQTPDLPPLPPVEQTAWEYELMGASPAGQMMVHYRAQLLAAGVLSGWQVKQLRAGRRVRSAGFVVVRQRPATAKGILFLSLEDESGLLDLVVKPPVYARLRDVLRGEPLIVVEGVVQRSGRAVSLLVQHAEPLG
jgi:error-prone DNA polymerase